MTTDPRVEAAAHANYVRNMSPVSKRWDDLDGDYKGLLLKSAAHLLAAADAAVPLAERYDYKAGYENGYDAACLEIGNGRAAVPLAERPDVQALLASEGERCVQLGLKTGYQNAVHNVMKVIERLYNSRPRNEYRIGADAALEAIAASLGVTLGSDGRPLEENAK